MYVSDFKKKNLKAEGVTRNWNLGYCDILVEVYTCMQLLTIYSLGLIL